VGLREITAAAGVAQGSFTNHFGSKEQFGAEVLDHYFGQIRAVIAATLRNPELPPLTRIDGYFDEITDLLDAAAWRYGCLAGNMALEAAEHSEIIREHLREIFAEWTPPFSQAIRDAQAAGQVALGLDADEAGMALLEAWHGAMLRMKVERSRAPLDRFRRLTMPAILNSRAPVAPGKTRGR